MIQELGLEEAATPVRDRTGCTLPRKVAVMDVDKPERLAWLQTAAPDAELLAASSPQTALTPLKDADALIGRCVANLVTSAPNLRWVQAYGAGVARCVRTEPAQSGRILLTNLRRVAGSIMAEHVIGLMLAMTRALPALLRAQDQEEFRTYGDGKPEMKEVKGRAILVAGLGGIGTEVARRASAFGIKVITTRNSSTKGLDYVSYTGRSHELLTLTPQADVIVNSMPLTPKTRHIFDASFFARMKKDAYFINVGRGGSIDQGALIAALNEGRIVGGALDVMTPEPLPKGHPLWKARNLVITPHVSAAMEDLDERWLIMREQLRRYAAGEKMLSVVDTRRGY